VLERERAAIAVASSTVSLWRKEEAEEEGGGGGGSEVS